MLPEPQICEEVKLEDLSDDDLVAAVELAERQESDVAENTGVWISLLLHFALVQDIHGQTFHWGTTLYMYTNSYNFTTIFNYEVLMFCSIKFKLLSLKADIWGLNGNVYRWKCAHSLISTDSCIHLNSLCVLMTDPEYYMIFKGNACHPLVYISTQYTLFLCDCELILSCYLWIYHISLLMPPCTVIYIK